MSLRDRRLLFCLFVIYHVTTIQVSAVPFFLSPFWNCCGSFNFMTDKTIQEQCQKQIQNVLATKCENYESNRYCSHAYGMCKNCELVQHGYMNACCGVGTQDNNCNGICCACETGCKGLPPGEYTG